MMAVATNGGGAALIMSGSETCSSTPMPWWGWVITVGFCLGLWALLAWVTR